jgi:hypothetical protein
MNKDTEKFLYENWFKLVLTFIALLALGIYAYQTLIVLPKEKADKEYQATLERLDKQAKKALSEKKLNDCQLYVSFDYSANFKNECKSRSLKPDCSLPLAIAESLSRTMKDAKENCYKEYKIDMGQ